MVFAIRARRITFAYHMPFPSYILWYAHGIRVSYLVKWKTAKAVLVDHNCNHHDDYNIGNITHYF